MLFRNRREDAYLKLETRSIGGVHAWEEVQYKFDVKHATISEHISNIFKEGELEERTSIGISDKSSGGRKSKLYNLDVIITNYM